MSRLAIVVPIELGARERVRTLLRAGLPFDPERSGLERHHVYLTDHEAIFLFESDASDAVERLADDPKLWTAITGWNDLVAGPPRLADEVYSWSRPPHLDEAFFTPTPGPGDSEGGDVFSP